MKRLTLLIFLVLTNAVICLAHSDFYLIKKYGNVTVRIKTGYNYEEIQKVFVLGQLTSYLLKDLKCNSKLIIDFDHHYTGECEPDYFVSYDRGDVKYTWGDNEKSPAVLNRKVIVIRIVSQNLDFESVLKLVEFSVRNKQIIKNEQSTIIYNKNYCQWKFKTIDTLKISKILNENKSGLVLNALKKKIFIGDSIWNFGTSYYYQDGKYNFIVRAYNGVPDTIALSIGNIYQVQDIGSGAKIVFDTDSSFYYVGWYGKRVISNRHIIKNTANHYRTFYINDLGSNLVSINFLRLTTKEEKEKDFSLFNYEQTCIYDFESDVLIQDIKKDINEIYKR